MNKIETSEQLFDIIEKNTKVIVLFHKYDNLSERMLNIFETTNIEPKNKYTAFATEDICQSFQISKIPQIRYYKNGNEMKSFVGTFDRSHLEENLF